MRTAAAATRLLLLLGCAAGATATASPLLPDAPSCPGGVYFRWKYACPGNAQAISVAMSINPGVECEQAAAYLGLPHELATNEDLAGLANFTVARIGCYVERGVLVYAEPPTAASDVADGAKMLICKRLEERQGGGGGASDGTPAPKESAPTVAVGAESCSKSSGGVIAMVAFLMFYTVLVLPGVIYCIVSNVAGGGGRWRDDESEGSQGDGSGREVPAVGYGTPHAVVGGDHGSPGSHAYTNNESLVSTNVRNVSQASRGTLEDGDQLPTRVRRRPPGLAKPSFPGEAMKLNGSSAGAGSPGTLSPRTPLP